VGGHDCFQNTIVFTTQHPSKSLTQKHRGEPKTSPNPNGPSVSLSSICCVCGRVEEDHILFSGISYSPPLVSIFSTRRLVENRCFGQVVHAISLETACRERGIFAFGVALPADYKRRTQTAHTHTYTRHAILNLKYTRLRHCINIISSQLRTTRQRWPYISAAAELSVDPQKICRFSLPIFLTQQSTTYPAKKSQANLFSVADTQRATILPFNYVFAPATYLCDKRRKWSINHVARQGL